MSEVKVNDAVRGLADRAKKAIVITGAVAALKDDFYQTELEAAGLDMDMRKKFDAFDVDFMAGTCLGFGELATEAMKKDKKLEEVELTTTANKDVVKARFLRTYDKAIGKPGEGERKTEKAYGRLVPGWQKASGAGSKGQLKKVKSLLSEAAASALK